ncbi:MAG: GNAT family protein [Pseudomonadota bacterium]
MAMTSKVTELTDPGFETDTLRFKLLAEDDKDTIIQSGAIRAMWDWLPALPGKGTSFDAYHAHTMAERKAGQFFPFVIFHKRDDSLVGGMCFLNPSRTHRRVTIGYLWIMPEHRGSGMFEMIQTGIIRRAYDWRAKRIVWPADTQNKALITALERMGVPREGVLRSFERLNTGRWSDVAIYAAVREEIPTILSQLEQQRALAD